MRISQTLIFLTITALLTVCGASQVASHKHEFSPHCPRQSVRVRKEWGELSLKERRHYIDAVLCLQKKPSQLGHALYNTTTRYEDFVVVHMNQTRYVQRNGLFLAWHRGFISLFEHALAKECGHKGTLPYWDWVKNAKNITASPLFDGSQYSFSGQGLPVRDEDKEPSCDPDARVTCPSGPGGGCVTDGPFKNYVWGYLPIPFSAIANPQLGVPSDLFAYTPRCFTRDINQYIATKYQTEEQMRSLFAKKTIADFQYTLDDEGLHIAGHLVTGGENGNIFISVQEPTFFLHHAMADRVWMQWQAMDKWDRTHGGNAFAGTVTSFDMPPSANATAETELSWGPLGRAKKLANLLAVGHDDLCYRYT